MKQTDLKSFIHELEIKMEKFEEDERQLRDHMHEARGAAGEIQLMIWKLEEWLK